MGVGASREAYVEGSGTEEEYASSFEEIKAFGEGEFAEVKLVVKRRALRPFAVKVLEKGYALKDNVLYAPKPEELRREASVLRTLRGENYNLLLDSVYESPSRLYLVTEVCAGGDMLKYAGRVAAKGGLRTEDVSRIARQLLGAVDHCERHNVIHRDIKPENIMFKDSTRTAELRLIDFGCAALDEGGGEEHTTFAGTAFYNSPEMFRRRYTSRTDVFSAGVVLYVLVAGYPAARLQDAFNLLQKAGRDLRTLPGMSEDAPGAYFEMLNKMLAYRWEGRASAGEMLDDEFVSFHRALEGEGRSTSMKRAQSMVLLDTGEKTTTSFGFDKHERSLTALLATMLDREDILSLVLHAESKALANHDADGKLGVIDVKELKSFLESMGRSDCVAAIQRQKNSRAYDDYSYEYARLKPFAREPSIDFGGGEHAYPFTVKASLSNSLH